MLGGSSGKTLMAFYRASATEHDALQYFADDEGWSWRGLLPFFLKSEHTITRIFAAQLIWTTVSPNKSVSQISGFSRDRTGRCHCGCRQLVAAD